MDKDMVAQTETRLGLELIAREAAHYVAGLIAAPGVIAVQRSIEQTDYWHLGDLLQVRLWQSSNLGWAVEAFFTSSRSIIAVNRERKLAEAIAIELMFQAQLERQSQRGRE